MRYYSFVVWVFLLVFLASCGVNIFSPFSAKDYPEANIYQGRNLIDQGSYAEVLSNAEKYLPQDHVAAALGIMGFDLKLLTNLTKSNVDPNYLLLSWLDAKDKEYVVDLAWGISRLRNEDTNQSVLKSFTLVIGGCAKVMLGILLLAEIANTNAINTEDGFSDNELDTLSYWLVNPPDNLTNLFRTVGKDRKGNSYTIAGIIGGGVLTSIYGINLFSFQIGNTNVNFSEVSNIISSFDPDGDGIVSDTEISNTITTFLSNLIRS